MNKIPIEDFRRIAKQKQMLMDNEDILFIMNEHNKLVESFCDDVLPKISENGVVDKGEALSAFAIYANGMEVRRAYEYYKDMKFDEKYMKKVIDVLNKPLPELYMVGQIAVQMKFQMFHVYAQRWWNMERYKKIYKADSPHKWLRKVKDYPEIDNGKAMAKEFNYPVIKRKVDDIINTKIRI